MKRIRQSAGATLAAGLPASDEACRPQPGHRNRAMTKAGTWKLEIKNPGNYGTLTR